jgi:hypothetical protein
LFTDIAVFVLEGPKFVQREVVNYGKQKRQGRGDKQMDVQAINEKVEGTQVNSRPQKPYKSVFRKDRVFHGHAPYLFQSSTLFGSLE